MSKENPFQILGDQSAPLTGGEAVRESNTTGDIKERIEALINSSEVFLFMKGTPHMPQCGFSANVIGILDSFGLQYKTFNILEDMDIREGVKAYANWPTYPQLWYKGELLGGNDIISEMYRNGELKGALNLA